MSFSTFARRSSYVVLGGGAYIAIAGFTYNVVSAGKMDQAETLRGMSSASGTIDIGSKQSCTCTSYTTSPDRNHRYQEIATTFDSKIDRDEFMMGLNWLRKSLLYFHAKGDVLEVAAGTGRNVLYYPKDSVRRVVLMDTSDQMLSEAKKKVHALKRQEGHSNQIQYAFIVGDSAEDLAENGQTRIPDNTFDTVVDTFGLCSYDNPVKALKEMSRVCKNEGGRILLLEHGRSKSWSFITNYLDKTAEQHAKNWGCIYNRDIDHILQQSGLVIERLHTWHFGTTYYVVCKPIPEEQ